MTDACNSFRENCAVGIEPDRDNIKTNLNNSLMLVTALNQVIGYDNAAKVAKNAYNKGITLKESALELKLISEADFDKHVRPEDMVTP